LTQTLTASGASPHPRARHAAAARSLPATGGQASPPITHSHRDQARTCGCQTAAEQPQQAVLNGIGASVPQQPPRIDIRGSSWLQPLMRRGGQVRIADVEFCGFVEFGMALGRGVVAHFDQAFAPWAGRGQSRLDVGRVGAVDEEVVRAADASTSVMAWARGTPPGIRASVPMVKEIAAAARRCRAPGRCRSPHRCRPGCMR